MVSSVVEKRRLRDISGAVAADMETGAVARIARRNKLPCLAVRSIVDKASLAIPAAAQAALNAHGEIAVWALLSRLARHPSDLVPLIQLSTAFRTAMQTLRLAARHAGPSLDAQ
jgi:adenosylhomocysteine nucleosidase